MLGWLRKKGKMKREIIINAESLETRVAVLEDGRMEEFKTEHPTEERMVGSVYKGKIQNLEHDLQAAFVDIGMKKNAFLHYWDMIPSETMFGDIDTGESSSSGSSNNRSRGRGRGRGRGQGRGQGRRKRLTNEEVTERFPPGSEIVVQVTKGAIGTKGPRVTASISVPGRNLVMMPGVKLKGVSRKIADAKERQRLKKILSGLPVPEGIGLIVRTAGTGARSRSFARDLKGLIDIWDKLKRAIEEDPAPCCVYREPDLVERVVRDWLTEDVDRIVIDSSVQFDKLREIAHPISRRAKSIIRLYEGELPIFDNYSVERQIDEAFSRKVTLSSGGCVILDETEALIAVDVNTGRHKGKGSQEEAILAVNMEAVEEVARQLRLRNIGGLIVIDLIDMKAKKHQNAVYRNMRASLKRDKARTNVLPISELGIMEMTRQRAEEGIMSSIHTDCPYCKGRGSVKSTLGMSVDIQRQISAVCRREVLKGGSPKLQIVVHPTVLDRLRREDEKFLIDLESEFTGSLTFQSDPSRHIESFLINDVDTSQTIYSSSEQ
jgi:ribonuclease G